MPLALLCGVGLVFGFFVLWIICRRGRIDKSFYPLIKRVGPVILTHYNSVECSQAVEIANEARELWEILRNEFPIEASDPFYLVVISDPQRRLRGWKPFGISMAVVNLACPDPGWSIRATVAEELHHIVWFRRFGDKPYEYVFDPEDGHLGVIIHYASNRFETEALRFVVKTTGERAELLTEVEEYIRRGERFRVSKIGHQLP